VAVIAARHTASVTSQVEGTLLSVDVRLGDFVATGDKLATIDDRPMREAAAAARASAAVRGAEARVAAVRARHAAAELQRQQRLQREGLVSAQAREAAEAVRAETKAELEKALAAAREAAAALESAERSLTQAVVRAPVPGLIATRFVDPGNEVRRGDALVRIVARETPWIRFGMPASRRESVKVGDAVEFASIDRRFVVPGRISHVAPDVDPLSELVIAEAALEAAVETGLYPGLGGYVSLLGAADGQRTTPPTKP
jgi:HlyD family secretion protein